MSRPIEQYDVDRSGTAIIRFANVTKRYGEKLALNDLSLSVFAGSFFGLLGPNGAGKTTAIRLMSTLTRPSEGLVEVGGCDIVKDAKGVRRQIGVVFQNNSLDDELTIGENLHVHALVQSMPLNDAKIRAKQLLGLMGMAARTGQIVKGLSGGEKRRVEIARALLHRPRILYLDEPTVGLDTEVRNAMWGYLRQLSAAERVTVVFTTHYLEEAEANADTVAVIKQGKLLACEAVPVLCDLHGASGLTDAYLKMTV